ncbi:hypothetical protein B7C51_25095 (plasmid) [Paenibacillus larvae subsp. pulvifaciens]|uniref:Bacteriophage lambda Replication protein O N-terminal domain-containing protein n=1 Tax=Paenibacillus larvae subsp. pulvifaciens TaxID=1477 RepID=A0A1V0V071_9BACL|nr:hypothetical protein [Paenibacillus larvae]ARF70751.1 hypothetical protein B7C51_25095 [Paenibacillus larvae subsp. pulvifaciens]
MSIDTFSLNNGFTKMPNRFQDMIINNELNSVQIRFLTFMVKYTIGWNKEGYCLKLTYTNMQKYLGFTRHQFSKVITWGIEQNLIQRKEINGDYYYRLNGPKSNDWGRIFHWEKVFAFSKNESSSIKEVEHDDKPDVSLDENDNSIENEPHAINFFDRSSEDEPVEYQKDTEIGSKNELQNDGKTLDTSSIEATVNTMFKDYSNSKDNFNYFKKEEEINLDNYWYFWDNVDEQQMSPELAREILDYIDEYKLKNFRKESINAAIKKFVSRFNAGRISCAFGKWFRTTLENFEKVFSNNDSCKREWQAM